MKPKVMEYLHGADIIECVEPWCQKNLVYGITACAVGTH